MAATPAAAAAASTPATQLNNAHTPKMALVISDQDLSQSTQLLHTGNRHSNNGAEFDSGTDAVQATPFPSAAIFTFIPELYNLLSRLRILEGTPQFKGQGSSASRAPTSSPLLNRSNIKDEDAVILDGGNNTNQSTSEVGGNFRNVTSSKKSGFESTSYAVGVDVNGSGRADGAIDIKDLPGYIYEIKQAIQTARDTVIALPDIDRTLTEQAAEIDDLKRKVNGLQKRLREFGNLAQRGTDNDGTDVVMKGTEISS